MDLDIYFSYRLCFDDNLNLGHILVYNLDRDHHDIREDKSKYPVSTPKKCTKLDPVVPKG
jgi:hypothetical protein